MIHKAGKIIGKRQYCSGCSACIIVQSNRKGIRLEREGKLLYMGAGYFLSPGEDFLGIKHIPLTPESACTKTVFEEAVQFHISVFIHSSRVKAKYGPKREGLGTNVQVNRLMAYGMTHNVVIDEEIPNAG